MRRHLECGRWALLAGVLFALCSPVLAQSVAAAPTRSAPTRPSALWPFSRLQGMDYVAVADVAERFNLKSAWTKPNHLITLSDVRGVRFTFEANQHDIYFDGARVHLGVPVLISKGDLWVSKLDVIKLIAPLFRPADHAAQIPAITAKVIVLDPGHGGLDPGAANQKIGITEKFATLDVSLRLRKILERQGWQVYLTREEDTELSKNKKSDLALRNAFANGKKADLFMSIHFNSAPESITGVETYTMSPQFMLSTGDDQGDSMTKESYPSNRFDYANLLFGEKIHRAMLQGIKTPDRGFKRGRKAVLRMLDCPGVLVECAYLSNEVAARRVATPEFRQQIAEALADGVRDYADAVSSLRSGR